VGLTSINSTLPSANTSVHVMDLPHAKSLAENLLSLIHNRYELSTPVGSQFWHTTNNMVNFSNICYIFALFISFFHIILFERVKIFGTSLSIKSQKRLLTKIKISSWFLAGLVSQRVTIATFIRAIQ
jgi:hypothetical protein